jgi:KaiC/GvpD/RAD55 family RecA-like ATPase
MSSLDIDKGFECFKQLVSNQSTLLSEADSRAKIIDPIFKECLGWDEKDITREEHVNQGFIDYLFKVGNRVVFVLEAKKVGNNFIIPKALVRRRYRINGAISTDNKIRGAIEQAQKYSSEIGATFAVVSNGHQFIIFESFKFSGKWRDGFCLVFSSLEDIQNNFSHFFSILSKQAVIGGSLKKYITEDVIPLDFRRPLDFVSNENATVGLNVLAPRLIPIIKYIFADITDDSQIEVLRNCYVRQKQLSDTITLRSNFDKLPHYAKQYDIGWFKESEKDSGIFQLSFEKCREFLKKEAPLGSVIMLLGGIGSGKTTFINHFFKVTLADRDDIVWFYIDFKVSPPEMEKIEDFIYSSIIDNFNQRYKQKQEEYLKSVGLNSLSATGDNLLALFTMLRYKGITVAIVLDNVDQHSYTSPKYQERVFELAQHLANKFKTITLLTLREESFFRSTRSGVLDAYHIPKFHVESPNFEDLIRSRIDYTIEFLNGGGGSILVPRTSVDEWKVVTLFFAIIKDSIRKTRRVGREILRFINDVSGSNMREALRFINSFMTSANTDIEEMITVELGLPPTSPEYAHYQIPLHHIIKSIVLEDHKYYSSSRGNIMNLFHVNPQYTDSHFVHLKLLSYLKKRINYFVALENGFIEIDQILDDAELGGLNRKAIADSMKKLSHYGLIEYNNQNKEGFETATYARITATGSYYLDQLINSFAYIDLVFEDTPICDDNVLQELRRRLNVDHIPSKKDRLETRFERTQIFLTYLRQMEQKEHNSNPQLALSDLTQTKFMDGIMDQWEDQIQYIRGKY